MKTRQILSQQHKLITINEKKTIKERKKKKTRYADINFKRRQLNL
jgi:hypothetical protein